MLIDLGKRVASPIFNKIDRIPLEDKKSKTKLRNLLESFGNQRFVFN